MTKLDLKCVQNLLGQSAHNLQGSLVIVAHSSNRKHLRLTRIHLEVDR